MTLERQITTTISSVPPQHARLKDGTKNEDKGITLTKAHKVAYGPLKNLSFDATGQSGRDVGGSILQHFLHNVGNVIALFAKKHPLELGILVLIVMLDTAEAANFNTKAVVLGNVGTGVFLVGLICLICMVCSCISHARQNPNESNPTICAKTVVDVLKGLGRCATCRGGSARHSSENLRMAEERHTSEEQYPHRIAITSEERELPQQGVYDTPPPTYEECINNQSSYSSAVHGPAPRRHFDASFPSSPQGNEEIGVSYV